LSSAPKQHEERRIAALCLLASTQQDWLSRHPDREVVTRTPKPETPSAENPWPALLWTEVESIEQTAGVRSSRNPSATSPAYWSRRYVVALHEEWRTLLASLPDFWRVLIDLSAAVAEDFAMLLGVEMIAQLAAGKTKAQINDLLTPLEEDARKRVFARSLELDPDAISLSVIAECEKLYRRGSKRRIGQRLIRWFSMSLLSSLLHERLTASQRTMAARHCRSDLFNVLNRPGRKVVPTSHAANVEAMALELLGKLRPIGDSSSKL